MARVAWAKEIDKGYVSSLSMNSGILAVVAPSVADKVYVFDARSGEKRAELLHGWSAHSVAVREMGDLLVTRGPQSWQITDIKLEVGITPPEDGIPQPSQGFTWSDVNQAPKYNSEVLLGKIALIPRLEQALIAGMSDDYSVKGFLLLAGWRPGYSGLSMFAKDIEEAPHDIVIADGRAYVATGRGGTIDVFDLEEKKLRTKLAPSGVGAFKPMRVVVSGRYVIAASYNELFWWDPFAFVGAEVLGGPGDCINGLAALRGGGIVCTLTFSNRLLLKHSPGVPARAIETAEPLDSPCWVLADPQVDGRIYVMGHSNGKIWAIDL